MSVNMGDIMENVDWAGDDNMLQDFSRSYLFNSLLKPYSFFLTLNYILYFYNLTVQNIVPQVNSNTIPKSSSIP